MKNENCDRKSNCDDYKHNHCDGCGANKPIGDLISRSELTKELRERLIACNDWEEKAKDKETRIRANAVKTFICEMFILLKEIPTVDESARRLFERPHGEWIKWDFRTFGAFGDWDYKCSNCEKVYGGEYNYCPNCGADMRKGEEE